MPIVDLSLELAHHMVRYPSPYLPEVTIEPAATHEKDARSAQIVRFGTHVSTHVDAPYHVYPDGMTIDQIPLETLCGPARVVRLPGFDQTHSLDLADLEALGDLSGVEKLILDTGWLRKTWGGAEYFSGGTFLTPDAAAYVAALPSLHLLGMDFPNVDAVADMKMGVMAPNHGTILNKEIILLENLTNLDKVPDEFYLTALPVKLVGGDGCPCRAIATFD